MTLADRLDSARRPYFSDSGDWDATEKAREHNNRIDRYTAKVEHGTAIFEDHSGAHGLFGCGFAGCYDIF